MDARPPSEPAARATGRRWWLLPLLLAAAAWAVVVGYAASRAEVMPTGTPELPAEAVVALGPLRGSTRYATYPGPPTLTRDGQVLRRFGSEGPSVEQRVAVVADDTGRFRYLSITPHHERLARAVSEARDVLRTAGHRRFLVEFLPWGTPDAWPNRPVATATYSFATAADLDALVAPARGQSASCVVDASDRVVYLAPTYPHQDCVPVDGNVLLGLDGRLLVHGHPWGVDMYWNGGRVPGVGDARLPNVSEHTGGYHVRLHHDGGAQLWLVVTSLAGMITVLAPYAVVGDGLEKAKETWVISPTAHQRSEAEHARSKAWWRIQAAATAVSIVELLALAWVARGRRRHGLRGALGVVDVAVWLATTVAAAHLIAATLAGVSRGA